MTEQAVIRNCNLGLGVGVEEIDGGRASIFVREDVITADYDGPAVREFMERVAVKWLEQVAPHRLAS